MASWALAVALLAGAGSAWTEDTVYERDYPFMHYSDTPVNNPVAQLQKKLAAGTATLTLSPQHGYLESLLAALNINPDSQGLVFSKTSLQIDAITPATPRAVYFNDDTYVAWVQKTGIMEIVTMDADKGPVFYSLSTATPQAHLTREALRCLTCHDSYGELGGGVPRFLFESTYDLEGNSLIPDAVARETTESTPIGARWGGWYVTGDDGGVSHLGNILPPGGATPVNFNKVKRGSVASLSSFFDTTPYLRPTSDIVALLVFEHQVSVHDQIVRSNFKARTVVNREMPNADAATLHWAQLPPKIQTRMDLLLRPLVDSLLMADAAPLSARVVASNSFAAWFQQQGPKDAQGRSLRQLDLTSRIFRYPLSYLIYTDGFNGLPLFAREHVYARIGRILQDPNPEVPYRSRSAADRHAALEILQATKPEFAQSLSPLRD